MSAASTIIRLLMMVSRVGDVDKSFDVSLTVWRHALSTILLVSGGAEKVQVALKSHGTRRMEPLHDARFESSFLNHQDVWG